MAGPKLADYLEIRERELESQISNVRGHLAPLEAELAQVRKMRSLIADARAAGLTDLASDAILPDPPAQSALEQVAQAIQPAVSQLSQLAAAQSETLTIKEMILRALRNHFKKGASPSELRDYMRDAFGKDVDRNSISPQLTRLRELGAVEQYELDGKWKLTRTGVMYDHPTSWKDLDKDEPPDPNAPNTRLADMAGPQKKKDDIFE
jgi:DNA-binding transcriptional ArsR family regulator